MSRIRGLISSMWFLADINTIGISKKSIAQVDACLKEAESRNWDEL